MELPEGCVGLLGPNGAGKTSLLKTFLGFVKPAAGGGQVLGFDIANQGPEIRQVVGYMPEQDCHIPGMSAVEFVSFAGQLSGMPQGQAVRRAHEVLEYCGLGEARYRQVETYSTGMKQRVKLAQALVHGPKLLLLDEPTNGLDPRGREDMLELVRSVSHGKGVNVVVSSHLLKDIERTCDSVVVVMGGTLRAAGPIRDLRSVQGRPLDVELKETDPAFGESAKALGLEVIWEQGTKVRIQGAGTPGETSRLVFEAARNSGNQVRSIYPGLRSLEEAFLEVVAHG
jgi:ABC-2 type transport system ATP-binding protein